MKKGTDIAVEFPGLYLVHQNMPGKTVDFHSHSEHILFIPLQGEIEVILKSNTLKCGPGKMIFLPGDTEHRFDSSSQAGERLIVLITHKKELPFAPSITPLSQLIKELCFYLLLHKKTKHAKSFLDALSDTLSELLSATAEESKFEFEHLASSVKDARVKKALEYLLENYDSNFKMQELTKHSAMSLRNFNRLFLSEVGTTPKALLTQIRIGKAKEKLLSGMTVTDVAFSVGYQSLAPFIQSFRQLTGQLPSHYLHIGQK